MISTRPAERDDILKVARDISPQSVADIKAMRMSPDETLGFFALKVPEPDAVAFVEDGEPIGLAGWDKEDNAWYSWSLGSARYFRDGDPRPVAASRRYLKRTQQANPHVELFTIMLQDTEKARKWMGVLGFYRCWNQPELNVWKFAG